MSFFDQLRTDLKAGNIEKISEGIKNSKFDDYSGKYNTYENYITMILHAGDKSDKYPDITVENDYPFYQDLLDTALEMFVEAKNCQMHHIWVHSLSHLTKKLWEKGQIVWLKKLYEMTMSGSKKTGNYSCVNRLVRNFDQFGQRKNEEDFFITDEVRKKSENG